MTLNEELQALLDETAGHKCNCETNLVSEKLEKILSHICDIRELAATASETAKNAVSTANSAMAEATAVWIAPVEINGVYGISSKSILAQGCTSCRIQLVNGTEYDFSIGDESYTWTKISGNSFPRGTKLITDARNEMIITYLGANRSYPVKIKA